MKKIWQFFGPTQETIGEQFRLFFRKELSIPFILICLSVTIVGTTVAWVDVSNLKDVIDTRIGQRKIELNKIYDAQDQKSDAEYQIQNKKYEECWNDFKNNRARYDVDSLSPTDKYLTKNSVCGHQPYLYHITRNQYKYLEDAHYKELVHIKEISSFQLFIENFSFGWWGVIPLVLVFTINLIVVPVRVVKRWVTKLTRQVPASTSLVKNNLKEMTPFQRYSLIIFVTIALVLIVMVIILIF